MARTPGRRPDGVNAVSRQVVPAQRRFGVVCEIPFGPVERDRIDGATTLAEIEFRPPPTSSDHQPPQPSSRPDFGSARVLISHWPPSDWGLASGLRWIQLDSAGVDYLARNDVWSRDVAITNAAGAYAVQIGQYIFANLLSAVEGHVQRRDAQAKRFWPPSGVEHDLMVGRLLRGQTVVILGYGGIGREVARLARTFGMHVVALKARPDLRRDDSFCLPGTGDPEGAIPDEILGITSLVEAARSADVLVVAVPLTARTRQLVDARVLAALSPGAWIVNVARGAVIDEAAMVHVLSESRIGGAILDVFEEEPLPSDSPLWKLPNVVLTPHVAGGGEASRQLFSLLVAENIKRFADDRPLINIVDRVARY